MRDYSAGVGVGVGVQPAAVRGWEWSPLLGEPAFAACADVEETKARRLTAAHATRMTVDEFLIMRGGGKQAHERTSSAICMTYS